MSGNEKQAVMEHEETVTVETNQTKPQCTNSDERVICMLKFKNAMKKAQTAQKMLQKVMDEITREMHKNESKSECKKMGEKCRHRSRSPPGIRYGSDDSISDTSSSSSGSEVEFVACYYGGREGDGRHRHHYHGRKHIKYHQYHGRHGSGRHHHGHRDRSHTRGRDRSHSRGRDRGHSRCRSRGHSRRHSRGHSRGCSRGYSATRDGHQHIPSIGRACCGTTNTTGTIEDRLPIALTL